MCIFDLFSKRQKKLREEVPDVYQYDNIDNKFRVQVVHITAKIFDNLTYQTFFKRHPGGYCSSEVIFFYDRIHDALCKEYGVFYLHNQTMPIRDQVYGYFLNTTEHEKCLDIIELFFQMIDKYCPEKVFNDASSELNERFKESSIGYQFESGQLTRIDSQFTHSKIVQPTFCLLKKYKGANNEFLSAHENYRHKRYKECLNDCLKSFESLMKGIHEKQGWSYDKKCATAGKLIDSCFENKLIPSYLKDQFISIKQLLASGVPTVRNREGAHGQGVDISVVSENLASYTLHLTATNLLFLAKCEEEYRAPLKR